MSILKKVMEEEAKRKGDLISYKNGWDDGYSEGHDKGYSEGFEKAKQQYRQKDFYEFNENI